MASGWASRARACRICSGVMAGGRPRRRPRARAAARPSRVPSTISSRMNSASAAKTWKTSRPPGVVVSRASCSERNPTPRRRSVRDDGDQVVQRAGEPVQARARPGCRPAAGSPGRPQLGPVGVLAGLLVGEHPQAARLGQGVQLAVQPLPAGGHPGVPDQRTGQRDRIGIRDSEVDTGRGWGHAVIVRKTAVRELSDTPGSQHVFQHQQRPWSESGAFVRWVLRIVRFSTPQARGQAAEAGEAAEAQAGQ